MAPGSSTVKMITRRCEGLPSDTIMFFKSPGKYHIESQCQARVIEPIGNLRLEEPGVVRGAWRRLVTVAHTSALLAAQPVIKSFLPVPGAFLEKPSLGMSSCAAFAHPLVAVLAILSPLLIEGTGFPRQPRTSSKPTQEGESHFPF